MYVECFFFFNVLCILLRFLPDFLVTVYLIGLELITAWTPHRPGLAVGIAQMCFGFGTILFSALFNFLNNSYGAVGALYISTVVLTAPCALSSCALKWPESTTCIVAQPLNYALESPHDDGDTYTRPCRAIRWQRLPFLSSFWLYMATIFVGQLGYAFLPYYFSIGESFGVSMSVVLLAFQGANLVSTLSRPFAGMLTDALKTSQGFFSIGTKNVLLILISVQTGLFFLLIPISRAHYFGLFVIASGIILSIFAAFACCASLLAREQFGWKSSTAVFGLGGGIAMCLGEFAAVMMMSACISSENGKDTTAYNGFYLVSGMCSLAGLVCCIFVKRCRQAFCLDDDGFGQTFVGKPGDETRGFADVCVGYGSVERHVCAEAIDGA